MDPKEYKYTQEHEWLCLESNVKARMGITEYAQAQLGDIVYLSLPEPGTKVVQFGKMGEIESVKAVSDLFSPASGRILEINQTAIDEPQKINEDPYGDGWLVRLELSNTSELDDLLSSEEYGNLVAKASQGS